MCEANAITVGTVGCVDVYGIPGTTPAEMEYSLYNFTFDGYVNHIGVNAKIEGPEGSVPIALSIVAFADENRSVPVFEIDISPFRDSNGNFYFTNPLTRYYRYFSFKIVNITGYNLRFTADVFGADKPSDPPTPEIVCGESTNVDFGAIAVGGVKHSFFNFDKPVMYVASHNDSNISFPENVIARIECFLDKGNLQLAHVVEYDCKNDKIITLPDSYQFFSIMLHNQSSSSVDAKVRLFGAAS